MWREGWRAGIGAAVLLAGLVAAGMASAEPVQEFSFEIRDVKSGGRFTVAYTSRNYDTTGEVPTSPNQFHLRLPAGAKLRKEFLKKSVFCNTKKLGRTRNPKTCKRAQVGTGRVQVDARPFITDPIPADLWLFLAKGTTRKAVASLAILGKQDQSAPVVRDIPVVRDYRAPIVYMNILNEPTPDGKYGYKLVFGSSPAGGGGGASFSIAETRVVNTGFSLRTKKLRCLVRGVKKCVKTRIRRQKLFWFTPPTCPQSGKVSFEAFFGYETLPDITKVTEISCPQFPQ
jgi:hypothetical protein